ncbi:hypothetical protein ACFOHQ_04710 [Xanthomonas fragariae]
MEECALLCSIRSIAKEGDKQMSDTPESRYAAVARRVVEAHEAQLLRDLQLINERTVRELGPLPHGGLPVQPKRKPKRAPWEQPVVDPPTLDADAPLLPQTPSPTSATPTCSSSATRSRRSGASRGRCGSIVIRSMRAVITPCDAASSLIDSSILFT